MNNKLKKVAKNLTGKNGIKNLVISIVILVEVLAILVVATFAWVETVSSIKITTKDNDPLEVDTYYFTEADIGGEHGTIDMGKYFEPAGDMHFAPCSSVDGDSFYFPKKSGATAFLGSGAGNFRKGNISDKNTAYMSVTFKLRANTNADFFFYFNGNNNPTFSNQASNMRVSVTAYQEGMTKGDLYNSNGTPKYTKVYANSASTTAVVGNTNGGTTATAVEAFSAHKKGTGSANKLFSVGASETKIVTINVWLQGTTSTANVAQDIAISNFGIISDLTPRHVTLLPTPEWDRSGETQYFYAWCWQSSKGDPDKLFGPLTLDDDEHYSFDYNGTYQKTLFIRAKRNDLREDMVGCWNSTYIHNKTEDTTIPDDPVDPTYIIETINSGSYDSDTGGNKSTGSWHDPATIHVAYAPDQSATWGTMKATSYVGNSTSTHVIETTNSSSLKHTDTVHAWPGKYIKLEATAATSADYAFEGWYTNAECTGTVASPNATYVTTAPATASDITYYAKFKEVRKLTIYKYVDGSNSSTAAGTITIGGQTSGSGVTSYARTFDKGTSVSFSATAATGYTLSGIYTTATGTTAATSPVTLNNNTTYYARFTTNSYNVTAHAYYSTNGGSTYTADSSTGGTVKVGSATAGATSTASVKYKNSVNLVASPESGYEFDGWYDAASGGTKLSSSTTYSYTLSTTGAKNVYARFIGEQWAIKYGVHGGSNWSTVNMSVSGNNVTGTMTLTEGQDFSFKITKTIGSTTTWYGGGGSYSGITSTSFISNLSMSTTGEDTYMKGHAGTYTFTFNKSTNKLSVTASYSNITITFNTSNTQWVGDASAIVWFDTDQGSAQMTKNSNSNWTVSVPSNYATGISFKRNNPGNTATWNSWNAGSRNYSTTYTTTGDGSGGW